MPARLAVYLRWLIAIRLVVITSVVAALLPAPALGAGAAAADLRPAVPDRRLHLPREPRLHRAAARAARPPDLARAPAVRRRPAAGHRPGLLLRRHRQPVLACSTWWSSWSPRRCCATAPGCWWRPPPTCSTPACSSRLARGWLPQGLVQLSDAEIAVAAPLQPRGALLRLLRGRPAHLVPDRQRHARRARARGEARQPRQPRGLPSRRRAVDLERVDHHRPRRPRDPVNRAALDILGRSARRAARRAGRAPAGCSIADDWAALLRGGAPGRRPRAPRSRSAAASSASRSASRSRASPTPRAPRPAGSSSSRTSRSGGGSRRSCA